ncbi:hypothetical protein GQ44DRAFT_711951 [Phaeosphaeriaceae sp. PMI808]|nr:hypothetical protein GQ44DRAFT_711951 [Phaeosphaeriaceae sp. PMI808]
MSSKQTPTPPPPLPTHLGNASKSSKSSKSSKGFKTTTTSSDNRKVWKTPRLPDPNSPFAPCYMFFYGSLMDPDVLQAILDLPATPTTQPATVSGFAAKMWSIYPAIVPDASSTVDGVVWRIESEAHFKRLQAYETNAYTWLVCDVELSDGEVLEDCRTFCWAGDPDSGELVDGRFDLARYQKYFKRSVTG